jgi:hypothetical protein
VDVVLSDDDDDAKSARLLGQSIPTDWVISAADDVGDAGKTLAMANIPGPIGVDAPRTTRPPAADQALTAPTSGARG